MQTRLTLGMTAVTAVALLLALPGSGWAQGKASAALTGQVSSEAEGAMEGVLVSARRA